MVDKEDKPRSKDSAKPESASGSVAHEVKFVPITEVYESAENARRHFDQARLNDLTADIGRNELINPLSVRKTDRGYELIAGARRLRACRQLGMTTVEVKIFNVDEFQARLLGLTENLSRENLNPYDEAIGVLDYFTLVFSRTPNWAALVKEYGTPLDATARLLRRFGLRHPKADKKACFDLGMTGEDALKLLGTVFGTRIDMNVTTFSKNRIRLLALHQDVQDALRDGTVKYSSALVLQRVNDDELRAQYIQLTIDQDLTVNDVTDLVNHGPSKAKEKAPPTEFELAVESVRRNYRYHSNLSAAKQANVEKLYKDLADLLEEGKALSK